MSDTNKKYVIDTQASDSPSAPIHAGSFTIFIIRPTCDNTADLHNGFIKAKLKITGVLSASFGNSFVKAVDNVFNGLWVGFKDAMDAVEKFEILANGISIYTQNFGPEESFITACRANEAYKRSDIYSKVRHKDIFNQKTKLARCGFFLKLENGKNEKTDIEIPSKIDLLLNVYISLIDFLNIKSVVSL